MKQVGHLSIIKTDSPEDKEIQQKIDEIKRVKKELQTLAAQEFTPKRIVSMVKDLAEANQFRRDSNGNEYTTPDWNAREKGLVHAMDLTGTRSRPEETGPLGGGPAKVVFNVVMAKEDPKKVEAEVVDVGGSENAPGDRV